MLEIRGSIAWNVFPRRWKCPKRLPSSSRLYGGCLQPVEIVLQGDIVAPEVWQGLSAFLTLLRQDTSKGISGGRSPSGIEQNEAKGLATVSVCRCRAISMASRPGRPWPDCVTLPFPTPSPRRPSRCCGRGCNLQGRLCRLATRAAPRVILVVLGPSFVLLLLVFRSSPIKAVGAQSVVRRGGMQLFGSVFPKRLRPYGLGVFPAHGDHRAVAAALSLHGVVRSLDGLWCLLTEPDRERYDKTQDNPACRGLQAAHHRQTDCTRAPH